MTTLTPQHFNRLRLDITAHSPSTLDELRDLGAFKFEVQLERSGLPKSSFSLHQNGWSAHPLEMPACAALLRMFQTLVTRPMMRDLSDTIDKYTYNKRAYQAFKSQVLHFEPEVANAFAGCVNEFLTSLRSPEAKLDTDIARETRNANAAILLTIAIAAKQESVTRQIVREVPQSLNVVLNNNAFGTTIDNNEWFRPAATATKMDRGAMLGILVEEGWNPSQKVFFTINDMFEFGDHRKALRGIDAAGQSTLEHFAQHFGKNIGTGISPSLTQAVGSFCTQDPHAPGLKELRNSAIHVAHKMNNVKASEVALKLLGRAGLLGDALESVCVMQAEHGKFSLAIDNIDKLDWSRLQGRNFLPALIARISKDFEWEIVFNEQNCLKLLQAADEAGWGHLAANPHPPGEQKTIVPLIDFISAGWPNATHFALQQGADPQAKSIIGHNAHWYARNNSTEDVRLVLKSFSAKESAMNILAEMGMDDVFAKSKP